MLKLQTKALAVMAVAGFVCAADSANAQQVLADQPVSITVQNNFTLARTNSLNFGTFVVSADTAGANTATLTMAPDTGTVTANNAAPAKFILVSATGQSRGIYAVSGAAPSTALSVSTSALGNLTCATGCTGTPPVITLTSVTPENATETTAVGGTATINLGAVLTTVAGGNQYTDGVYQGDFDLTVSY